MRATESPARDERTPVRMPFPSGKVRAMAVVLEPPAPKSSSVDPASLGAVLAEIAETASETLELQAVFERVATAIRRLVPLDNMGVVRILEGQWAVMHATTRPVPGGRRRVHRPGAAHRLVAAPAPAARPDRAHRRRRASSSTRPSRSTPPSSAAACAPRSGSRSAPAAASAAASGRARTSRTPSPPSTRRRCGRSPRCSAPRSSTGGSGTPSAGAASASTQLEARLGTLAESLDVREVFARISEGVQAILPHDLLVLTELDARRRTLRIVASAGEARHPGADRAVRARPSRSSHGGRATTRSCATSRARSTPLPSARSC